MIKYETDRRYKDVDFEEIARTIRNYIYNVFGRENSVRKDMASDYGSILRLKWCIVQHKFILTQSANTQSGTSDMCGAHERAVKTDDGEVSVEKRNNKR